MSLRLSVLATAAPTVTGPCQLPQPLPLTNKATLERLGTEGARALSTFGGRFTDPLAQPLGKLFTFTLLRC